MKYVVIRTDSERETVVVGKSASKKEAENILRNDFEEWFWQKVTASKDASFEEVYALYEDDECKLSEDSAWLNGCHHTDFDWVILDAETEDVLSKPMSMKEMVLATSEDNSYVQGNVAVDLDDVIGCQLEEFLDLLSEQLVGNDRLTDVHYKVVDTLEEGKWECNIVVHVSGDASGILEVTEEMAEELKKSIFEAGVNAMEEFLGHPLTYPSDEDMMAAMDEVFEQMPEEEQLRFYRKYVR